MYSFFASFILHTNRLTHNKCLLQLHLVLFIISIILSVRDLDTFFQF